MPHDELQRASPSECRRIVREREDTGDAKELHLYFVDDVLYRSVAVRPVVEPAEDNSLAHRSEGADEAERALDVLGAAEDRFHLLRVAVRVGEGRAFGRDHDGEEEATILGRYELALERAEDEHGGDDDERRCTHGDAPIGDRPAERALITRGQRLEPALEPLV